MQPTRIVSSLSLILMLLPSAGLSAADKPLRKTDLFTAGEGGYFSYRIPALIATPQGTLLAFCEGRKTSRSDDGDIDMLLRRSTDDGRTWLPTQLVHEEGGDATIKFGNPCPVVDTETGTIWLVMNRSGGARSSDRTACDIFIMSSSDEGKTWSKPRDISDVKRPGWKHYAEGPGIGIQLRHGPHKGRLIVPANYRDSFSNRDPSYSHIMYSDDHGKNWKLGGIVGPHTNECQLAEFIEGGKPGLLLNMRNHWGRAGKPELSGKRLVSRSFDGGATWSEATVDETLIEPICQASLLRYSFHGEESESVLLFSNPAAKGRENMTVRLSYDEGRTWPLSRVVDTGTAAYSSLARLGDGRVGIVYERNKYKHLTFAAFPLESIKTPQPTMSRAEIERKLTPHFSPPAEFANDYGKYKSMLTFNDGTRVATAADWKKRRQEIADDWHKLLGPWPELVKQPKVHFRDKTHRENFTEHRVHVQVSARGQLTEGRLLVPDGEGPFPAVLVTFYDAKTSVGLGDNGKGRGTHDYGLQLARRGFVTLSINTPGTEQPNKRTRDALTEAGEQQDRQPLTFLAYAAANCHTVLAQQPMVDAKRIGVVGLSFGGKWSMFASCLYDKFACAVWSDPGIVFNEKNANVNYWEPWYLGYEAGTRRKAGIPNADRRRTGLYKRLIESNRDLNELHALMCPRPVLLAGGTEDPPRNWRAVNHMIRINKLLGHNDRVAMTHRKTHVPTPEALEKTLLFLEYFLGTDAETETVPEGE